MYKNSSSAVEELLKVKLLTTKEIAKLLRCNLQTVYRMVKSKQIPHFYVGDSIRFNYEEIINWTRREPTPTFDNKD